MRIYWHKKNLKSNLLKQKTIFNCNFENTNYKMTRIFNADELGNSPKGADKIKEEKQKLRDRITKINVEIAQFENNIGFFAKSSGADAILKDVRAKIENSKKEIGRIKEQMKMLDEMGKPPLSPKMEETVDVASATKSEDNTTL